jgi:hypothetical protein
MKECEFEGRAALQSGRKERCVIDELGVLLELV